MSRSEMGRRELIACVLLVLVLLAFNAVSYLRMAQAKRSMQLVVETSAIKLSINAAGPDDLVDLPGIGPVLADRIIAYRLQRGGFDSLEELKNVKGVGDKLFEKILPHIRL